MSRSKSVSKIAMTTHNQWNRKNWPIKTELECKLLEKNRRQEQPLEMVSQYTEVRKLKISSENTRVVLPHQSLTKI